MVRFPTLPRKIEVRNKYGHTLDQFMHGLMLYLPGAWSVWLPADVPGMTNKAWELLWSLDYSPAEACLEVHENESPSTWFDDAEPVRELFHAASA